VTRGDGGAVTGQSPSLLMGKNFVKINNGGR
jgi:hypothetical protein